MTSTTQLALAADAQDGLPRQFVSSLKILFDILDEEHTGLIRLRDIESRWSDEGVKDLPPGVVEGLQKVVPPNGLLTFENFVSGLKLALFRGNDQLKRRSVSAVGSTTQKENRSPSGAVLASGMPAGVAKHSSSPNQPLQTSPANRQQHGSMPTDPSAKHGAANHKHRSAIPHYQQKSHDTRQATVKPQPSSDTNRHAYPQHSSPDDPHPHHSYLPSRAPPPPPPRPEKSHNQGIIRKSGSEINPPQVPPRDQRQNNQKMGNNVKHWQRERMTNNKRTVSPAARDRLPVSEDSHAIYANIEQFQHLRKPEEATLSRPPSQGSHPQSHSLQAMQLQQSAALPSKATVRRHGSGRRHTLQNGVDQNLMKRLQQLEEEGKMLTRGMEMVDLARDWYLRQLAAVSDKQRMVGKVNYNDNSLEAHQERMNFQRARISEVNLQLRTLVESSEKGFPLHMNLAVTPANSTTNNSVGANSSEGGSVHVIREQNRRLTQEMSEKTDKIVKLEQEKATLIRELFEARSKHKSHYDDTTFM